MYGFFEWFRTRGFGNSRTIPSLDGLRAVAVLLVVVSHLCGTVNFWLPLESTLLPGTFGVRVFFVISGYLITTILLSEYRKTGTIALRRFYFRRSLRLFPAAYVFIAANAVLAYVGLLQLNRFDLVASFTYTSNYYNGRSYTMGHLWTLAVEEQFYLIWPFIFLWLGPLRSTTFLKWLLISTPLLRLLSPYAGPAFNFVIYADSLGTGCLLALWKGKLEISPAYRYFFTPGWVSMAATLAFLANYIPSTKVMWLVGETSMNCFIALVVHWTIANPASPAGRFLNWPPLVAIGVLSYSLYLWQQPFSTFGMKNVLSVFPLNLVMMFTAAILSYLLIETPFLRLRNYLEQLAANKQVPSPSVSL